MNHIILTLGGPNDDQGRLSRIAQDRLEYTYSLYKNNDNTRVLCTGGFGDSFNQTVHPHAYYAKQFLVEKGVQEKDFLEFTLSANTVEDFRISKPIIEREHPDTLMIVTSDFHMERVKILHDIIMKYPSVIFIPAKSSLTPSELAPLLAHEKQAIELLKKNNFVLY